MEDIFYALLTPSQAAIMLYGLAPPTPRETPEVMRNIFVKKEKIFDEKYVGILEKTISVRKDIEHGVKKTLSGKELDELLTNAEKGKKTFLADRRDEGEGFYSAYIRNYSNSCQGCNEDGRG